MAQILSGKEVSEALNEKLKADVEKLKAGGIYPALGIIRVGERPDDIAYERGAEKRAEKIGIIINKYQFASSVGQTQLVDAIRKINSDAGVHGVLLLRPMPPHIDDRAVCAELSPSKDVDGITAGSMAGVYSGSGFGYAPCTAEACIEMLKFYGIEIAGRKAVVIGRSLVIGKPVAMMLLKENATVTVCHTKTADIQKVCSESEILVAATGKAKSIDGKCFNGNQVVIDVGINMDEDGKLCGDVDFSDAEGNVRAITPVPGGVGAVTTAILMKHVAEAAKKAVK